MFWTEVFFVEDEIELFVENFKLRYRSDLLSLLNFLLSPLR